MTTTTTLPRAGLLEYLNISCATATDLRSQVKQAHWNVVGAPFIALPSYSTSRPSS